MNVSNASGSAGYAALASIGPHLASCQCAQCRDSLASTPATPILGSYSSSGSNPNGIQPLDADSAGLLQQLKARDQQVRRHEQAHINASGGLATGGPSYTYQRGPDGRNYAIGGEVQIDVSPGNSPEETLRRAQLIRAAALAPADPSGADRAIAARANSMELRARSELAAVQRNPDNKDLALHTEA